MLFLMVVAAERQMLQLDNDTVVADTQQSLPFQSTAVRVRLEHSFFGITRRQKVYQMIPQKNCGLGFVGR